MTYTTTYYVQEERFLEAAETRVTIAGFIAFLLPSCPELLFVLHGIDTNSPLVSEPGAAPPSASQRGVSGEAGYDDRS